MRLDGDRESGNIEDRRGMGGGRMVVGGGMGLGGLVLIIILMLLGVDPRQLLQNMPAGPPPGAGQGPGVQAPADPKQEELKTFTSKILASTEDVWHDLFKQKIGREYKDPALVLFSGQVQSACGFADAAVGPFYCPGDDKVYLDMAFYDQLQREFHAPGDFAQAYVIAHEIGHHVQNQLGISDQIHRAQQRASESEANALSVRLELQADYLAGVWAHHAQKTRHILEEGDIEEGLNAASQIGDDRLQQKGQGRVRPDSFTHGSSAQRLRWFREGLKTGEFSKEKLASFFSSKEL